MRSRSICTINSDRVLSDAVDITLRQHGDTKISDVLPRTTGREGGDLEAKREQRRERDRERGREGEERRLVSRKEMGVAVEIRSGI